jgi:hypothetical protein
METEPMCRLLILVFLLPCAVAAQPVCTAWIRTPQAMGANAALARVAPEVHEVTCGETMVEIRSAGLSLYQFGILANPVNPGNGLLDVRVLLPRHPVPETWLHMSLPAGMTGIFVNGVPIENHLESDSFEGRNLWRYDLNSPVGVEPAHSGMTPMFAKLLSDGSRHSPIIGFALDGYPIYGPWGYANGRSGELKRMRSGYRLRAITERTSWPDGTKLTPGQYGPPIDAANPLGVFSEDYEYVEESGDLDRFNGRYAVTPEYPEGTYAYFVSTDAQGQLAFPYLLASQYYGHVAADFSAPVRLAVRPEMTLASDFATPRAGVPVTFDFEMKGHPLEYVHEKAIHLIVVSGDLSEFSHIHPERTIGDSYHVVHTFEHGGHYRLYAEFTEPGEGPRIESFDIQVAGKPKLAVALSATPNTRQSPGGLRAELSAPNTLLAGTDYSLKFRLNTTDGLEPYLGTWGHFVLIEDGLRSFIHAHPMQSGQPLAEPATPHQHVAIPVGIPPPDVIEVPVAFPHAGLFKLWAQFQVNGKVQVIPFVLRVAPNTRPVAAASVIPRDAIHVSVGPGGFVPSRIEVPAGKITMLALTRDPQPNCASKVVFPDLNIMHDLPPGQTVLIQLPPMPAKEMKFACGMGMYRGLLVVK